jgi:hypothetical protein
MAQLESEDHPEPTLSRIPASSGGVSSITAMSWHLAIVKVEFGMDLLAQGR